MEKSFWDIVGIPFQIKTIEAQTISEAVKTVYESDEFYFYGSSWFVDIKKSFRIFKYDGEVYISKKTNEKKADAEIENSKQAEIRLKDRKVNAKRLDIVVPLKIKLDGQHCFLVSKYVGSDINECVYANSLPHITILECLSIVKILLENGIAHRGFLPRNTVEKEGTIYLFDWEDARFTNQINCASFDHLWRTNFLLNWSYLFDFNELDEGLKNTVGLKYPLNEPPLVKYEIAFRELTDGDSSNKTLRNTIDRIVSGSELQVASHPNGFYIRPNDMGHLIADIFPSHIDVLHDILSYSFRKHDERKFSLHIKLATLLFTSYFESILVKNQPKATIQYYALIPILMMLDDYISEEEYLSLLSEKDLVKILSKISSIVPKDSITKAYLSSDLNNLLRFLATSIRNKIKAMGLGEGNIDNINTITKFVGDELTKKHTSNI